MFLSSISSRPPHYEWTEQDPKYPFLVLADVVTKNNIRNHPEFQVSERDHDVLDKLKQMFRDLVPDYQTTGVKEIPSAQTQKGADGREIGGGGGGGAGENGMDVDTQEEVLERERAEKKEQERQNAFKEVFCICCV
jgi:hypothetical protein